MVGDDVRALVRVLLERGVGFRVIAGCLIYQAPVPISEEEKATIKANEPEIIRLLADGEPAQPAPSRELARRVEAFRAQLDRWTRARRSGVPLLKLPGLESRLGECLSCGEPLASGRTYRCAPCVAAVELVLGLSPVLGA